MEKISSLFELLSNKYLITFLVFIIWISFFDRNDLITQWERKQELEKLETSTMYYEAEINHTRQELTDLDNNPAVLEKLAREKFYLKRPNEDVFIVEEKKVDDFNFETQ